VGSFDYERERRRKWARAKCSIVSGSAWPRPIGILLPGEEAAAWSERKPPVPAGERSSVGSEFRAVDTWV